MISCHTKKQFLWKKVNPRKKKKKTFIDFSFSKIEFQFWNQFHVWKKKKIFSFESFHSIPFRAELAKRRFEGNNNERPSLVLVFYRCSIIFDKKLLFMNMEWLVACGWLFIGLNMGVWVPTSLSLILESLEKLFLAHLRREKKWHGEKKSSRSLSHFFLSLSLSLSHFFFSFSLPLSHFFFYFSFSLLLCLLIILSQPIVSLFPCLFLAFFLFFYSLSLSIHSIFLSSFPHPYSPSVSTYRAYKLLP